MVDDGFLLALLKSDPERGLALAISEYGGLVKRVILTVLPQIDSRDLEECVADSFWRFYSAADRFQAADGTTLKSYLCGIARHLAIDRLRQNKKADFVPLTFQELGMETDFAEDLQQKIAAARLRELIFAWGSPDKEIFVLRYFFANPVGVIAKRLDMTEKAVESRLYRGRKRLKAELLSEGVHCDE
jgi:RNA polymerase sigma-70 factor (ECF subfamily)